MTAPTPLRSDEEVAGMFISVTLGGQVKSLPVLPRARNREFQKFYAEKVRTTLKATEELVELDDVINLMANSIDEMMEVLLTYDESAALGGKEWVDRNATDREIYEAFKKVTDAAHPFGKDLLAQVPNLAQILMRAAMAAGGSRSTSSSPPSTAGRRKKSKAA
jgi:hypothetical protein